jgi:hypothetical protein
MHRVVAFTSLAGFALGASWSMAAPERAAPVSKRLAAFAKTCEEQRVAPVREFQRHLLLGGRSRAAWTIVVRSQDETVRLAHAQQIARAAQGTLRRVEPALISKTIGETEKNLDALFQEAEQREWILFFDEADALFGKRTEVDSAHDRYANQEVSYLLGALAKYRDVVVIGTRSTETVSREALERFADRVVTATLKQPGPVPPLPWREVCWTAPTPH